MVSNSSSSHFMLPGKRAAEGEVVVESSLIKKAKLDSLISTATTTITSETVPTAAAAAAAAAATEAAEIASSEDPSRSSSRNKITISPESLKALGCEKIGIMDFSFAEIY